MKDNEPNVGSIYTCYDNRGFFVEKIDLKNRQESQIKGIIKLVGGEMRNYSCTLATWERVWRDRTPPADPSEMKIG